MGRKAKHGVHGENKKVIGLSMTQTGIDRLEQQAKAANLSKSELVEQFARGEYQAQSSETLTPTASTLPLLGKPCEG